MTYDELKLLERCAKALERIEDILTTCHRCGHGAHPSSDCGNGCDECDAQRQAFTAAVLAETGEAGGALAKTGTATETDLRDHMIRHQQTLQEASIRMLEKIADAHETLGRPLPSPLGENAEATEATGPVSSKAE